MMLSRFPSSSSPRYPMPNFSPAGLHVLVVDDDPLCLMVLERMLRLCNYKVTTSNRVSHAVQLLREDSENFDLVLSDVYMPDEDGFKLLEIIGLELDLPVIMMSANGETTVVMKGITHGACDYLIKPVRMEELRNIWQHVVRKKGKDFSPKSECEDISPLSEESQELLTKKRKEQESLSEMEDCNIDDISSLKKARVNWSVQLHQQFVSAVNQLGVDSKGARAVPKRILEIMNVQGLTRENVASHLQKYRLYLKRLSGVASEPYPIASFQAAGDGSAGGAMHVQLGGKPGTSLPTVKGFNLGAGVGSGPARAWKIDNSSMKSLSQFKLHQQTQVANRAQVLGSLGLADQRPISETGLQRMSSLDLSFFLQAQYIGSPSLHVGGVQLNNESTSGHGLLRATKLEEEVVELHRPMQGWGRHAGSCDKPKGGPRLLFETRGLSLGGLSSVSVTGDVGSSTTEKNVTAHAHDQASTNSTSSEVFSDCSFDALVDLGPPMNLPSSSLLPPYLDSTELDIADYLQLDDQAGFTCHN